MIKVRYLIAVAYARFLMEGVSVTSHRDDVKMLPLRQFTVEARTVGLKPT